LVNRSLTAWFFNVLSLVIWSKQESRA